MQTCCIYRNFWFPTRVFYVLFSLYFTLVFIYLLPLRAGSKKRLPVVFHVASLVWLMMRRTEVFLEYIYCSGVVRVRFFGIDQVRRERGVGENETIKCPWAMTVPIGLSHANEMLLHADRLRLAKQTCVNLRVPIVSRREMLSVKGDIARDVPACVCDFNLAHGSIRDVPER